MRAKKRRYQLFFGVLLVLVLVNVALATDYPQGLVNILDFGLWSIDDPDFRGISPALDMAKIRVGSPQDRSLSTVRIFTFINATEMFAATLPAFGGVTANSTYAGGAAVVYCTSITNEEDIVSGYIASTNNSGTWQNATYVSVNAKSVVANLSLTWNATVGAKVYVAFYANNSVNNWAGSGSTLFTLIATPPDLPPDEPDIPPNEPPPPSTTIYLDFYYYATTQTVNGVTGYAAKVDPPNYAAQVDLAINGSAQINWGFRVWLQFDGTQTELTSGNPTAIMSQSQDAAELLSATWTAPHSAMTFGKTALKFVLYSRWGDPFGAGEWTTEAVYVTNALFYKELMATDVTFYLYSVRSESGGNTYASAFWGTSTYASGITNVAFRTGSATDWQGYYLHTGSFFGFLLAPYTAVIGNAFYAIVLFGLGMSVYIRYKQFSIVVLLIVLLSGAGGAFNLLVGDAFMGIVWLVCAFGLGLVYWRVFR